MTYRPRNVAAERYNGDVPYNPGRILYQRISNLIPGATYEVEFYAVANVARNLSSQYYGSGIAYLFANDVEEDIDVILQDGCDIANYSRKLVTVADENGVIAYGIANRKAGGQWYVAKAKSLRCVGIDHTANLLVRANKFGTFVAPFDVVIPEGVTAFSAEVTGGNVVLTSVAGAGDVLLGRTPVILYNETGADISESYSDMCGNVNTVVVGDLVGSMKQGVSVPLNSYVLQTLNGVQAFYVVRDSEFPSAKNRCYIAPQNNGAMLSSLCILLDGEDSTRVNSIDGAELGSVVQWYSADGSMIQAPKSGINIGKMSNGETIKVIIK